MRVEVGRRQLFKAAGLLTADMALNTNFFPTAVLGLLSKLQAQSGAQFRDIPGVIPTFGEQSFPWMSAKENHRDNFATHDQLEQQVFGSFAYSIYRGSTGDLIQNGAEEQAKKNRNGLFWTGWCAPASVAAWCLPWITEDRSLPGGLTMSRADQMFLGTVYSAYGLVEREWGRLDPNSYAEIQDIHANLKENQIPKALIADTSDFRGYPGQEWWGCVYGFNGNTVNLTSFLESSELQFPLRKPFDIPFNQMTRVKLIDPSQPQPGLENNYNYTLNRNIAMVCLGIAESV